jgi:hypothetical protein
MNEKFIAFKGIKFTIEWYYDLDENSKVLEYFEKLTKERKKKILRLFELIGTFGKIFNKQKFRYEGDQIYAFKIHPDRFFCFFYDGCKIIITNAYEKKSDKLQVREKEKALTAKEDYIKRLKRGYDEQK